MEKSFSIPISRRSFMKLAGMTAAGAILGGTSDTPKAEAAAPPAPSADFSEAELPVLFDVDVCVVGGGTAGTAAAISAAQKGANVVLVERGVTLGGLATQGCVYPCMRTYAFNSDTPYITELNRRMEEQGVPPLLGIETDTSYGGGQGLYVPECLTWVYDEWCEEAGVEVLYDASLVGAITEGGAIAACVVQTVEGLAKITAKVFIDATGDALLSRFAGVPTEKGSEKTGRNQPMSLRFEMSGIDLRKVFHFFHDELKDTWLGKEPVRKFQADAKAGRTPFWEFAKWKKTESFFKDGVARGELTEDDILYIQAFAIIGKPDTMSMNCPEMPPLTFSATDAISRSQSVTFGRKMTRRLAAFFKAHIPGFEKAFISR
ncbi:MAG: FAD-dependent oxidoreductase [Schwartzia sp.]|nr:FAD-dependent oxidoreductase [Schwartzia sp. (in: firmicutes)]